MDSLRPLPLTASLREKIWGRRALSPYYADRGPEEQPVGESWLADGNSVVAAGPWAGRTVCDLIGSHGAELLGERRAFDKRLEPTYFPILAKLLFVDEKLSVQVHPNDEYALDAAGTPGKTEMWYIVDAEPGASVALGLTEQLSGERLRDAAMSGEIEKYLRWERVAKGDVIFVPPGLLHTMGAGVTICEIQQNSDVTYRFFDFGRPGPDGRPRALHLHDAAAVLVHHAWPGVTPRVHLSGDTIERELLAACPYFAAERILLTGEHHYQRKEHHPPAFQIAAVLHGRGRVDGYAYGPGSCFLIPAATTTFTVEVDEPTEAVVAYEPDLQALRTAATRAGASPQSVARALLE